MYTVRKEWLTNRREKKSISSNSKTSKNKNVSVIKESIIKDIKDWELSNESDKFVIKLFVGATTKDMESYIQTIIERPPSKKKKVLPS